MSEREPPDFAMRRAVEILAEIYERRRPPEAPAPPFDRVVTLFSETLAFDVTTTTRVQVERALGIAFAYPARGWHTYCVRAENGRAFLSCFYSDGGLVSVECYVPKLARAPALEPRDLRFRLVPGEIALGAQLATLPENYARIETHGFGAYDAIYEARFPGGSSYAMGNGNIIERLAIYALRPPTTAR